MAGSCERGNENLGSIKVRTISSLLEVLLAFQEGPCSIKSSPKLANISEVQCPNCLHISKKLFRVPTGIVKCKTRPWILP